ncbi:IST1 family protein [Phanerochaete sordida]|uniref:IST1 family protein n=1 Tax=Phanerochaete sordida TaxID=48140 RepID=A0A9P3L9S7_9APHY|nr:IST1 family protein [Phanerochaete sordida]
MVPWNAAKAKVQLRLGVQRLRTLQEKKAAQAKAARRDIAMLVEKDKLETARIKVENIINEDIYVELLELLELYCELLLARFGVLDQPTREPDPAVSEGVCAIIYAAPRTELKELHVLRDILMHKYGRDFSAGVMENKDGCVTERVTKKLATATPSAALVDAYLGEIAKGYGIAWTPPGAAPAGDEGRDGGATRQEKPASALDTPLPDAAAISAEARSNGARTPKLPEVPPSEDAGAGAGAAGKKAEPPEDDFEALAKRFAALKKR